MLIVVLMIFSFEHIFLYIRYIIAIICQDILHRYSSQIFFTDILHRYSSQFYVPLASKIDALVKSRHTGENRCPVLS